MINQSTKDKTNKSPKYRVKDVNPINWEQRKWEVYKDTITTEWNGVPSDKGALDNALRTAKAAVEFYKNNI